MLTPVLALLLPALLTSSAPDSVPSLRVTVDSARKEVVVTAGPFVIPHVPKTMDHGMMHQIEGTRTRLLHFSWPMEAWFRGFDVELADGKGHPLDGRMIHHINVINFGRRQLLYPAVERMLAAGAETGNVDLPKSIGMPMAAGSHLAMYAAWDNTGEADIEGAWLTVRLKWSPRNLAPRPQDVLLLYADVNYVLKTDAYDLPAGRSSKSYEFTMPLGGRLLMVGGHAHDYAEFVSLEDAETGKTIVRLEARTDSAGLLLAMPRKYYGVRGDGLKLTAGRTYRVRADYHNPTGQMIPMGAMGLLIGVFVPDDYAQWPALDPNDPDIKMDVAELETIGMPSGGGEMDHEHMDHN